MKKYFFCAIFFLFIVIYSTLCGLEAQNFGITDKLSSFYKTDSENFKNLSKIRDTKNRHLTGASSVAIKNMEDRKHPKSSFNSMYSNDKKKKKNSAGQAGNTIIPKKYVSSRKKDLKEDFPLLHFQTSSDERFTDYFTEILYILPKSKLQNLRNVIFHNTENDKNRGLGGSKTVIINTHKLDQKEFSAVLVHEFCHTMDLGGINEPIDSEFNVSRFKDGNKEIYLDDPSVNFYQISWFTNILKHKNASPDDFVSGYAKTDPFEDLAESCAMYVLHNRDFKKKALENPLLTMKYQWIKRFIFDNREFQTGGTNFASMQPWDITVLDYDIDKLLALRDFRF